MSNLMKVLIGIGLLICLAIGCELVADYQATPRGLPYDRSVYGFHLTDGFWAKRYNRLHSAWDLALPEGTPIFATMDGSVVAKANRAAGLYILVINGEWQTGVCHMLETQILSGQWVHKGQLIGFSGNSGSESTGPHCHYWIERHGIKVNPQETM